MTPSLNATSNSAERFEAINKAYYETHAQEYFDATVAMQVHALYQRFLARIPARGRLLDAGSGSGRDTLAFLKLGYEVDAFDVSPRLAALSTRLTSRPTRVASFDDFTSEFRYDGIWACASLLHVHRQGLSPALSRLTTLLQSAGVLYASFKYGSGARASADGRWFTDLDEYQVEQLMQETRSVRLLEVWRSERVDPLQEPGQWLNLLVGRAT